MERLAPCNPCLCLLHRTIRSMHKLHHVSILLLVLHAVGCNPSPTPSPLPSPDNTPKLIAVQAASYEDEQPILAYAIAQVTGPNPSPSPGPVPTPDEPPKVGDTCPNCDGRGTSGDGITRCKPCGGDGKVDDGDPILNPTAKPDGPDETAPGDDYATRTDFEKLQESVVASLHELNKHLKDLEDRANKAFDQTQEGIEANQSRINELEAKVKALEINLRNHTLDHPSPGKPTKPLGLPLQEKIPKAKYEYALQYEGAWYYWNEGQKAFVNLTTLQSIPFPDLTNSQLALRLGTDLQVCNGTQCVMCRIVKVAQ